MSPDDMREVLTARGYKWIGEGNFSAVYARPGSATVLKVGDNEDDWASYARLCRANQDNPHFPKIERLGVLGNLGVLGKPGFLIARMERLLPINPLTFIKDHLPMMAFISLYTTQSLRSRSSHWEYANLMMHYKKNVHTSGVLDHKAFEQWVNDAAMKCPRPLAQALMKIKTLSAKGLEFDFKPENFMERHDGTIVLTDPIWNNS